MNKSRRGATAAVGGEGFWDRDKKRKSGSGALSRDNVCDIDQPSVFECEACVNVELNAKNLFSQKIVHALGSEKGGHRYIGTCQTF